MVLHHMEVATKVFFDLELPTWVSYVLELAMEDLLVLKMVLHHMEVATRVSYVLELAAISLVFDFWSLCVRA